MTEINSANISIALMPQPTRPFVRGTQKYDLLREAGIKAVAARSKPTKLFDMHISATSKGGEPMDNEQQFLIDLIFKPNGTGLKLRPAETQLLLAHIGEILQQLEADENSTKEQEAASCK